MNNALSESPVLSLSSRTKNTYLLKLGYPLNMVQGFGIALALIERADSWLIIERADSWLIDMILGWRNDWFAIFFVDKIKSEVNKKRSKYLKFQTINGLRNIHERQPNHETIHLPKKTSFRLSPTRKQPSHHDRRHQTTRKCQLRPSII
jgi:hypothetical protein